MKGIAFIGGIHGVGKSQFSSQLAEELGLKHASAGELISRQKREASKLDKKVRDVAANQDILIAAIQTSGLQDAKFILDGHFCLLDAAGSVKQIPLATFSALAPACVLVLTAEISVIRERLLARDGKDYPADLLNAMQQAEIAHAKYVCETLRIPLEILSSPDVGSGRSTVRGALGLESAR